MSLTPQQLDRLRLVLAKEPCVRRALFVEAVSSWRGGGGPWVEPARAGATACVGRSGRLVKVAAVVVDGEELCPVDGVAPYRELLLRELGEGAPRVHVRMCACGEPGCWSLTARSSAVRGEVVRDDWREGVENGAEPVDLPVLRFAVRNVRAAVASAGAEAERRA